MDGRGLYYVNDYFFYFFLDDLLLSGLDGNVGVGGILHTPPSQALLDGLGMVGGSFYIR
jgi:hypothetical protein